VKAVQQQQTEITVGQTAEQSEIATLKQLDPAPPQPVTCSTQAGSNSYTISGYTPTAADVGKDLIIGMSHGIGGSTSFVRSRRRRCAGCARPGARTTSRPSGNSISLFGKLARDVAAP
jgi:hypothetical protein